MSRGPDTFGDDEWLPPDESGPAPWRRLARPFRVLLPATVVLLAAVGLSSGAASRTPLAATVSGAPALDRQLLWFARSLDTDALALHLRAIDWHGTPIGTLTIPCRGPCSFAAAPDGERLLVYEQEPRGEPSIPGTVYDAQGRKVGTVPDPPATWADDSRHLCKLRPTAQTTPSGPSEAFLEVIDPAHGVGRLVASIGGANNPSAVGFWAVLACSATTDRAVVAFSERSGIHNVRVIQLSTGEVLYRRDDLLPGGHCGCPVVDMAVSANGELAVENLNDGRVRLRDLITGATGAWPLGDRARGSGPVLTLSWHGRLAITSDGVIDVRSGRFVWRPPSYAFAGPGLPRPGADDLLLYQSNRDATSGGPRDIIVQADGQFIELPFVEN